MTGTGDMSFEEAVGRLEGLVAEMESGELSLEESLDRFEQAVRLSRRCAETLQAAEQRIRVLTGEGETPAPPDLA